MHITTPPGVQIVASGAANLTLAVALGGGTTDVPITLSKTFPDTGYEVQVFVNGGSVAIPGTLTWAEKPSSRTTNTYTLRFTNTALVAVSLLVNIHLNVYWPATP